MDKRHGILIVSVTLFVLCFVGTASATTWSVDDSGGADFTGIQDAINNASDGDTIIVHSGVYYANVVVDKSVTLIGNGQPVVDAGGRESAITLTADGITLQGFNAASSGFLLGDAGIKVISSNNTITGNNASNNYWYGIALLGSSNNTITGNNASSNNRVGIELLHSCANNITGNHIRGNDWSGIFFERSSNNTVIDNKVSNNSGFGILCLDGITLLDSSSNNTITGNVFVNDGLIVSSSYQNTVEDNTVNGKPLVYLEDVSDYKVEDAGQIILINCNNITVENLDLSNISAGIELWATVNSKISNNNISNNWDGIILYKSYSNTITGNKVSNNSEGIRLHDSNNNYITGNNVNNNGGGIFLDDSNNNRISRNTVCNNVFGICLPYSSNNNIYLNNFINHSNNAYSEESTTIWNSPFEITYTYGGNAYTNYVGNYWDEYEGTDADGDGIGDTHYSIYSEKDESDDYPLMKPFENYILPRSALT